MLAGEPSNQAATADARNLAAWTLGTHVFAAATVLYELLATGLPVLILPALMFAAIVCSSAIMAWQMARVHRTGSADLYFWSYGAGAFLFACTAGAGVAVLALVAPPGVPPQVTKLIIPALVALAMFDLYQTLEAARVHERQEQARFAAHDPVRATSIIILLASTLTSFATAIALVLGSEFAIADALLAAGVAIVLVSCIVAAHLGLELRRRLTGAPAGADVRRRLLVALDRAAMQSGAIREIADVEAHYTGPAALRVILHIAFKDGVSAQHIGPVLERLKSAAVAEVPEVTDVMLATGSALSSKVVN